MIINLTAHISFKLDVPCAAPLPKFAFMLKKNAFRSKYHQQVALTLFNDEEYRSSSYDKINHFNLTLEDSAVTMLHIAAQRGSAQAIHMLAKKSCTEKNGFII